MGRWRWIRGWLVLVSVPLTASANEPPTYRVMRAELPPRIDGLLEEDLWKQEPTFELRYQFRPGENQPAPISTRFWIAYDNNSLYVAVWAEDPAPQKIRARYSDRDKAFQDDFVGIWLDTFADERRAYELLVNPLGVQMDLIQDDVTGKEDASWDGVWESAGRISSGGYSVELAVPWTTLRFPENAEGQIWRIHAFRNWPREHRYQLSLVPIDRNRGCFLCQAARLEGLQGLKSHRDLEVAPTLVGAREDSRGRATEASSDAGLTLRWGPTSNLTLQGAWNPDFSQVEADAFQLDVNRRFALFLPEKRPFFLESSELFRTRLEAVYTRAISQPRWALRLTGKRNRDAFGLALGEDEETHLLLPGAQSSELVLLPLRNRFAILRYRRDLPKTGSILGFLYTGREASSYHNRVAGFDLFLRPRDAHSFRFEALGSTTLNPVSVHPFESVRPQERTGTAWRGAYQFQNARWESYWVYEQRSAGFRADLGFIPQVDIRRWVIGAFRVFRRDGSSWFNEIFLGGDVDETRDTRGNLLERELELRFTYAGPRQSQVELGPRYRRTFLHGVEVEERQLDLYAQVRPLAEAELSAGGTYGDRADWIGAREGRGFRTEAAVHWTPGRHWAAALDSSSERLDLPEGRLFEAQILRLRLELRLNLRTGIRWIGQWSDIQRNPALYAFPVDPRSRRFANQLLFSWKLKPQTVVYLGASEDSSGQGHDRVDLVRTQRTFFLKLGYAWNPF